MSSKILGNGIYNDTSLLPKQAVYSFVTTPSRKFVEFRLSNTRIAGYHDRAEEDNKQSQGSVVCTHGSSITSDIWEQHVSDRLSNQHDVAQSHPMAI